MLPAYSKLLEYLYTGVTSQAHLRCTRGEREISSSLKNHDEEAISKQALLLRVGRATPRSVY